MFMPIKQNTHKCGLLIAHKVKKACGNIRMWSQWHKNRQAHWNVSKNTLSVLNIWATYITNHCALCNASLLIFKRISLWSNYNWAFICFVPWIWGINALWREFSGTETNVSEAENIFHLIAVWPKSTGRISPIKTKVVEDSRCHRESCCYFLFHRSESFMERSCSRGSRLKCADLVTAVTKLWQLLLSSVYFDSTTLKALAPQSRCDNLHNSEV